MPYDDKPKDDDAMHEAAIARFTECEAYFSDEYEEGREDSDFVQGINQWDDADVAQRDREGRPSLVINQLLPFKNQILNNIKQARPAVRVSPVDDKADIDTAEVFQGAIRAIERQSKANSAYDMGASNAITAGRGWIRIGTDYAEGLSFDQDIFIERVMNFESVYINPQSTAIDGSDIEYAFIFDDISHDEYKSRFPDEEVVDFATSDTTWNDENTVRIAEYFYKEFEEREIVLTENDEVLTRAEADLLIEGGMLDEESIVDTRTAKFPVIKHCLLNGEKILEKTDWAGKYIPIVPVYGEEAYVDGKRVSYSLIRQAKDPQRMFNYWKTASTEFIALQQKAPYIAPNGSFKSFSDEWENANNRNYPYLEYDVVYGEDGILLPPPIKQPPIMGSPSMMQEAIGSSQDIRNSLGMHDEGQGAESNAISGIAIRNRQITGDNANFHFMDNLSASIAQVGCILVDLIPKIYSKRKMLRILGEDGEPENVPINQGFVKDLETGDKRPAKQGEAIDGIYKLGAGTYDVVCDVGASYSSKRQEMADKLTEIVNAQPELMGVVGDMVFEALDLPMGNEIAKRLKAQMAPEMLGDDPQAAKLQQAAQAVQQLEEQLANMDAALQDKKKNEAFANAVTAEQAQLDRDKFMVDAEKAKAEIAKIYAEINKTDAETKGQSIDNIDSIIGDVGDLKEAVEMLIGDMENDVTELEVTIAPDTSDAMLTQDDSE